MRIKLIALSTIISLFGLNGCQTLPNSNYEMSTNEEITDKRIINQVEWDKTGDTFQVPDVNLLEENQSQLIFYRPFSFIDKDYASEKVKDYQDSVNIGINNQFHTSLQTGQYSQVVVCSGEQILSTELTNNKTNRLDNQVLTINPDPKQIYYYEVLVNPLTNTAGLVEISKEKAEKILKGAPEQTHQLNRITADNCLEVPPTPVEEPEEVIVEKPIVVDVLFDFDSSDVRNSYQPQLKAVAEFMQQNITVITLLEGHTDNLGPVNYNIKLSEERAMAVKNILVNKYGITSDRVFTYGYGESQPIDTNSTPEGRQNNRRVVAIIKQQ